MSGDKRPFAGIRMQEAGRVVASPFAGYLTQTVAASTLLAKTLPFAIPVWRRRP